MKFFFIVLIILLYNSMYSQKFPVKRVLEYNKYFNSNNQYSMKIGDYPKDLGNIYNPYVGTWCYKKNDLVFILKLQKIPKFLIATNNNDYFFMDRILSTFKIIKNGIVVIDNLNAPIIETFYQKNKEEKDMYGSFMLGVEGKSLEGELKNTVLNFFSGTIYPVIVDRNNEDYDRLIFKFNIFFRINNPRIVEEPLYLLPPEFNLYRSDVMD